MHKQVPSPAKITLKRRKRMKTKQYPGIDYGCGITNRTEGIHFGVIPSHRVLKWEEESIPEYSYFCPKCSKEIKKEEISNTCPYCGISIDDDEWMYLEPNNFNFDSEGILATQNSEDVDIFILDSPFYTYCQFCSPCAPGAGYLLNSYRVPDEYNSTIKFLLESGNLLTASNVIHDCALRDGFPKVYCFDKSWFIEEKIPYLLFSKESDLLII